MNYLLCCEARQIFRTSIVCLPSSVCHQHQVAKSSNATQEAKPFSDIPAPKGLPFIGAFLDMTKFRNFDVRYFYDFIINRHKQLGPIYRETAFLTEGVDFVMCSSPEDLETLFRNDDKIPNRPSAASIVQGRVDNNMHPGIANVQGEEWYQIRKLYNGNMLKNKSIWAHASQHMQVAEEAVEFMEKNLDANNEVPDFHSVLCKWALESIMIFSLNSKLGAFKGGISEDAKTLIDTSLNLFDLWAELLYSSPLWKYFPTKKRKELAELQKKQFTAAQHFIQSRPKVGSGQLEKSLQESDLTDSQKEITLFDILAAGVDTTTNATSFALYCLAINPEKQDILREEINQVLKSGEVTGKTLQSMRYLHACHLEAQRMFPLVIGITRVLQKDLVLSGYHIPAGTVVALTGNVVNNMDEVYFDDPHSYIPERWMNSANKEHNRFALSGSFGMGARKCPGRRFALQEIGCLLIALLSRYRIEYHHEPFKNTYRIISTPSQKPRFTFLPL